MGAENRGLSDITYVGILLGHGGDALQMLELAKGVKNSGTPVRVIVPEVPTSESFKDRCDALGIECVRTPLIRASMEGAHQRLPSVLRLLRSLRSPIVHFHTGNSCLPRSFMVALELLRYRPTIVTLQSPYETIDPRGPQARLWAWTTRRRVGAVVSPSRHGSDFQLRCGVHANNVRTIRNCIDVDVFASGDPTGPRAIVGAGPDDQIVLFCSRIDPQKRPVDAVKAFAAVADEFPRAILVLLGGGSEEATVVEASVRLGIQDRVKLVGYQTNVPDWLAASTVWILPTERENFSVAVLEALAAGCAVLSTPCPGNDEVLIDRQNSLTFPVGDVTAAAAGLRELLRDDSLRERLGQAGRDTVQGFTAEEMVKNYRLLYEQVASPLGRNQS